MGCLLVIIGFAILFTINPVAGFIILAFSAIIGLLSGVEDDY